MIKEVQKEDSKKQAAYWHNDLWINKLSQRVLTVAALFRLRINFVNLL